MHNTQSQFQLSMTGGLNTTSLGVTTTVKQQVDNIQITLQHFRRAIDTQKKQQGQIMLQLKKLQQKTHRDYTDMFIEIQGRSNLLLQQFKQENQKQNRQFEYLQLQGSSLAQDHYKLNQFSQDVGARTQGMEGTVGI